MPTPLEILLDPVSLIVLAIYGVLMIWEAVFPAQQLPKVKFWKLRGLSAFAFFFYLSSYLPLFIDPLLEPYRLLDLTNLTTIVGGLVGVLLYEFGVYVWHYALHKSDFLWRTFHQMHHSAERLDTYGAFYFSPMDMIGWTILGSVCFSLLVGLSPQAITVMLLVTNFLGMFQHANIKTPMWLGYIIQRPESHTVHHAKGIHQHNYSDLPIFDILFGTFKNPKNYEHQTGFFYGASAKVWDMLTFKDLNKERKKDKIKRAIPKGAKELLSILLVAGLVFGCSKDDGIGQTPGPVQEEPTPIRPKITAFSPQSGPYETEVTIVGSGFGTNSNKVRVYFNDMEAVITGLREDQLVTKVPKGALSGVLRLEIDGAEISVGDFTYEFTIEVNTFAGSTSGLVDGALELSKFDSPVDMVEDSQGNLFITDTDNHAIRKIDLQGNVSVYAGGSTGSTSKGFVDGFRLEARFDVPMRIAIDHLDNLYITDLANNAIRKITPEGNVQTLVHKFNNAIGVRDSLNGPNGVAVDADGLLYVADTRNHRILKVQQDGQVIHWAGQNIGFSDGYGFQAEFYFPKGMTMGNDGHLYVADSSNESIRKISMNGEVTTVAGTGVTGEVNGNALEATFDAPVDLQMDREGNLFIADSNNHSIRMLTPYGQVSKLLGNGEGDVDGDSETAQLSYSSGLFINSEGTLFVVDTDNSKIKKIGLE